MRMTIQLDDLLLRQAKKLAAEAGRSLTAVIEDALRETLNRRKIVFAHKQKLSFPTSEGRGLRPGIDLDASAELLDILEDRR